MKKYTIGALFTPDFEKVLLIEKQRPEWQKGRLNFPGGHIEEGETGSECIAREFNEEANVFIPPQDWMQIGMIENEGEYFVEFFTTVYKEELHGVVKSLTDEELHWVYCANLPEKVISNLRWLVPFAINCFNQGNADNLAFGHFMYKY